MDNATISFESYDLALITLERRITRTHIAEQNASHDNDNNPQNIIAKKCPKRSSASSINNTVGMLSGISKEIMKVLIGTLNCQDSDNQFARNKTAFRVVSTTVILAILFNLSMLKFHLFAFRPFRVHVPQPET
jgi:hypothetical protein